MHPASGSVHLHIQTAATLFIHPFHFTPVYLQCRLKVHSVTYCCYGRYYSTDSYLEPRPWRVSAPWLASATALRRVEHDSFKRGKGAQGNAQYRNTHSEYFCSCSTDASRQSVLVLMCCMYVGMYALFVCTCWYVFMHAYMRGNQLQEETYLAN